MKQPCNPHRLVIKVGTSTLTQETGSLNLQDMEHLTRVLADLKDMGYQPVLVSSGVIDIGTKKLRLGECPTELRMKQVAAAVGRCRMMHIYDKFSAEYDRTMVQIFLTGEDVESPVRLEHLYNTFETLLELGVIPVVSENDSVSSAEIETGQCKVLGDNDTLSAIVTWLCGAGLLVLFSDIDGLYDADPRTRPDARLIHQVEAITPKLRTMAGDVGTWRGIGDMATKLNAAQLCLEAGMDMVIVNGVRMEALYGIVEGKNVGTCFSARRGTLRQKRRRNPMTVLETQGLAARHAARALVVAGTTRKNAALEAAARTIETRQGEVLAANVADLEAAMAAGLRPALLDRLALDEGRIAGTVEGVRQVAALPDPTGTVTKTDTRPSGLTIGKRRVPLGVADTIYEVRPSVTADTATLCFKSDNAALLRGDKEVFHSNQAFAAVLWDALEEAGLPRDCMALVADISRESANELVGLTEYLDVLIPRGGTGLIRSVVENARVSVIQTSVGVCHIYAHERADLDMAARILYNAKTSRPSVCNTAGCVLVDWAAARDSLSLVWELLQTKGVEPRGCPETRAILGDWAKPVAEADWDTEFSDYILAVKVVSGFDEAVDFIATHGTGHSKAIVTTDYFAAQRFLDEVDAAMVYVNASARFTDGFELGLGVEIGISTQRMHAWGPIGLEELTSSKYVIHGTGQVR